jgi:hypothetical protein
MRGKMNDMKTYTDPYQLNQPMYGECVGKVMKTGPSSKFKEGDMVMGMMNWCEWAMADEQQLHKVPPGIDPEAALCVIGMTAMTAYFGLMERLHLKQGETIVITGGAGAVGTMVGQIAKIMGCKVIGIAGGEHKVRFMKENGFDFGIDYKTPNWHTRMKEMCPDGFDVCWDNVGGEVLDNVMKCMKTGGRIMQCGAISMYNSTETPMGPRPEFMVLSKRLTWMGFLVYDYINRWNEGMEAMMKWYKEGKLMKRACVRKGGIDDVPKAFMEMMEGKNMGKMMAQISNM